MSIGRQSSSTTQFKAAPKASAKDAIKMLTSDHKKVKTLFKEIEKAKKADDHELTAALALQVCNELTVHAQVEEEIFYPAVREAIDDDDLMNEAEIEHASAKDLIAQISVLDSADPMFDAKLAVLSEYINHHVKKEEEEMFAKAIKAKLDYSELGEEMLARKTKSMEELGMNDTESIPAKRVTKK